MTQTEAPAIPKDNEQPEDTLTPDVSMDRQCLRCRSSFPSTWVGERICTRCKTSSAWRQGSPMGSHSSSGRQR